MKDALIQQFRHQWRMLASTANEFTDETWEKTGHGLTTPPLIAYHIISAVKFYIGSDLDFRRSDDLVLKGSRSKLDENSLPSRFDITANIPVFADALESWIENQDLEAVNEKFAYTGPTIGARLLFMLRHSEYHLGELGALLNEALEGKASDHFADTLTPID